MSDYHKRSGTRARLLAGDEPSWLKVHPRRGYIVSAILSVPAWVDKKSIDELYAEARWRTEKFGELYVVDHYPFALNRPDVCGLTVHNNLRVMTARQNAVESNTWRDRIQDMFSEPEQLCLL